MITITAIHPEARDLIDWIMKAYKEHYRGVLPLYKKSKLFGGHCPPKPVDTYGVFYWLVRHSGLVVAAPATNPANWGTHVVVRGKKKKVANLGVGAPKSDADLKFN